MNKTATQRNQTTSVDYLLKWDEFWKRMRRGSAFTPQGREILVLCRISVSAWQRNHCSSTLYLILQAVWYQEMPPSFVPKLTPPPNPFQCGMHGSYSSHFLHLLLDCLGCLRTKAHAPWPNFFFQFTLCSVPQVDSKQSKAWKKTPILKLLYVC